MFVIWTKKETVCFTSVFLMLGKQCFIVWLIFQSNICLKQTNVWRASKEMFGMWPNSETFRFTRIFPVFLHCTIMVSYVQKPRDKYHANHNCSIMVSQVPIPRDRHHEARMTGNYCTRKKYLGLLTWFLSQWIMQKSLLCFITQTRPSCLI